MFRSTAATVCRTLNSKIIGQISNTESKQLCGAGGLGFLTKSCTNNVKRSFADAAPNVTSKRSFGAYALLLVPVGTFCAGTMQVKKSQWISKYIEKTNEKLQQAPIPLPEKLDDLDGKEYRRFVLRGTFDHKNEVYVTPFRPPWGKSKCKESLNSASGRDGGYEVIVPFKLAGKDTTILLNRGWVPKENKDPETRMAGQVEGEVEVVAIYPKQRKFPFKKCKKMEKEFEKKMQPEEGGVWRWKHVDGIAKKLNTSPLMFEVVSTSSVEGGPEGAPLQLMQRSHQNSIIALYTTSLVTSLLWYGRYVR